MNIRYLFYNVKITNKKKHKNTVKNMHKKIRKDKNVNTNT